MDTKIELTAEEIQSGDMQFLLNYYLQLGQELEELQASISVIKDEMIVRLDAEGTKGKVVGEYAVTKVTRVNFRPTLEQARELAATKTVESVDTQALKRLHDQGVEIPNTTTTSFVMVKPLEKKAE
jgi:hypothetical protein